MLIVRRQITACPQAAARSTARHSSAHGLLWEVHLCHRHRALAAQLAGSIHVNGRRTHPTTPVDGELPGCGTLVDHQPIDLAVESHTRIWLTAPASGADHWLDWLRTGAELAAYVRAPEARALEEIVRTAESGPDDPALQRKVLSLLAIEEKAAVLRLGAPTVRRQVQ
ncbi:hypothetical protein ACIQMP_07895 [Streptomyces sp. NPDC091385]|uniref:hypothetical protein n=1 Tax=Streptomyces sp. NPDC091385 TaxID=3365997 RepID=UPI0037F24188